MAFIQDSSGHDLLRENDDKNIKDKFLRNLALKRFFDIVISASVLVLFAPALALVALVIKLTSKGPVLFRQERYGLKKRTFVILKFRTMTEEACNSQFAQTKQCDARVTAFGAFLRRTSIDEFPQFFNALRGDMSVVGPRPHVMSMDDEMASISPFFDQRYEVRPGITGLSQCKGYRGPTITAKDKIGRIARDLFYVRERNVVLDMQIIFQTIKALLTKDAF